MRTVQWPLLGPGLAAPPAEQPLGRPAPRPGGRAGRRVVGAVALVLGPVGTSRCGRRAGARLHGRNGPGPQEAPPLEYVLLTLQKFRQDFGRVEALVDLLGLDIALGPGLLRDSQLRRKVLHLPGYLIRSGPVGDCEGIQVERGEPRPP